MTCGPAHILAAVLWHLFVRTDVLTQILTADLMYVEELQMMDRWITVRQSADASDDATRLLT